MKRSRRSILLRNDGNLDRVPPGYTAVGMVDGVLSTKDSEGTETPVGSGASVTNASVNTAIATDPAATAAVLRTRFITETTNSRTLTEADNGSIIIANNPSGCLFLLPAGLADGFNFSILSIAGESSLVVGPGVSANGLPGPLTAPIPEGYAACSVVFSSGHGWIAVGNVGLFSP